jgi:small subunit ribosomal protein S11
MAEETKKDAAATAAATAPEAAAPATPPAPAGPPSAQDLLTSEITAGQKVIRAKGSKNISKGVVHVLATFNNTIVSVTDLKGAVIGWSSAGKMGYKGSRKSTAYAAQLVSQDACRQAMGHGLREADVYVKGPGAGRESAVRAVQAMGIEVSNIKDVTPVPHNGCRPPKPRRV